MRKRVASLNELLKNSTGSMTVEFVAFAPLLIAALVIAFEFGRAFWAYDVITRDLRASVRYLARNASTPPPYDSDVCPTTAQNVAQTGSPATGLDANRHFPWKGVTATFSCPSVPFTATNYNDDGRVVTMTVTVPMALTLGDAINRVLGLSGAARIVPFSLRVSYQTRYVGN